MKKGLCNKAIASDINKDPVKKAQLNVALEGLSKKIDVMEKTELNFVCTGMKTGKKIPIEYTGRGQNISPEFIIKNLLPNAKTLAITLEDLTHQIKKFTHWII